MTDFIIASSLGYNFLRPTEPLGILILIIGTFFTGMILVVFFNVNQDKDSIADKRRKEASKLDQAQRISRLYPEKK